MGVLAYPSFESASPVASSPASAAAEAPATVGAPSS
jgi:hypothetical protein